jgi:hypothetical protein
MSLGIDWTWMMCMLNCQREVTLAKPTVLRTVWNSGWTAFGSRGKPVYTKVRVRDPWYEAHSVPGKRSMQGRNGPTASALVSPGAAADEFAKVHPSHASSRSVNTSPGFPQTAKWQRHTCKWLFTLTTGQSHAYC